MLTLGNNSADAVWSGDRRTICNRERWCETATRVLTINCQAKRTCRAN